MSNVEVVPQTVGGDARPSASPKRPRTLVVLLLTTALTSLAGIAGAIIVFAGGRQAAETAVITAAHSDPAALGLSDGMSIEAVKQLSGGMYASLIDEAYGTLTARAGFAIFLGAWLLVAALCARNAARTARAFITAGAVMTIVLDLLIVVDISLDSVTVLSFAAMVLSLVVLVLCWLPPNNRFARARRTAG